MEDTAIIRLFQERSQQAIAELSQKYGKLCQSLSRRILNNEEDAKECVNDTWLGVWNSIPPQTPNPLVSYVCRITRNLSVKRLRHNMAAKRNSYYDVSLAELEECIPAAQEQEPWEEQEVTKVLERFLRELDSGSRVMFVKRYWYAESVAQIAETFGMKETVCRTDASAQKAEKETGEGGCSVMRKSEKLSDAIGEISDDIIEEAYTYKPKHDMHQRKASFKWRAAAAVLAMLVLAGVGVSVGGGTSFFRLGTIVSRFTGKAAKVVYRIQGIPVTQQEIQAGVALRVENGEPVKTAKKEVIKDIITKKTLYALAKKNGCTVSDQEYDDYAKLLKTQMNKAENRKEIRDFYAGFGGESAYWKNMEPVIRQNLAVRKYIDSQTGTQTEEEIKQEAYESGAKQTDLDAFEQVVEDVCEEIGDYLKTLQKSDASVYYFASSDKERVTKSIDKEEICAIGNHTIVTREQVQMYTKFYEITYDKTLSEKKAIAYAKERNALYVAAMQNGYQVTDEQVKAYVEELKQNLDGIWTKEQKEKLLSGFCFGGRLLGV